MNNSKSLPSINMRSSATMIKGQGVGSCYEELVSLISKRLPNYDIRINSYRRSDIYHYHTINPNYFLERLFNNHRATCIGYVHFIPDTLEDSLSMPSFIKKWLYKYLVSFYNGMDYLVTVNPSIIAKLRDYHIDHPEIIYIPNFVSSNDFYVQPKEDIAQIRKKYAFPPSKTIVLGVGQLQTRKGILDFINTARQMPHLQFVWAGDFCFGKMSSGFSDIREHIKNSPSNLTFLGIVERRDMCSLYNACDIFFLPSYDELFPMSVLEALSCGKPVVLRDIEVYKDILKDYCLMGKGGEDFIRLLTELDHSDGFFEKWRKKSLAGSQAYSENYVLKRWAKVYNRAYQDALSKRKHEHDKGFGKIISDIVYRTLELIR